MDEFSKIIIGAVDKIKDSVIKIDVTKKRKGKQMASGSGSGFVFSSDGYAFTNSHKTEWGQFLHAALFLRFVTRVFSRPQQESLYRDWTGSR